MNQTKINELKLQKEIIYMIMIKSLKEQNEELIYKNQQLEDDLDYAKRNGGIKRLVLKREV